MLSQSKIEGKIPTLENLVLFDDCLSDDLEKCKNSGLKILSFSSVVSTGSKSD